MTHDTVMTDWINRNIDINIEELTEEKRLEWVQLFAENQAGFFAYAAFGFLKWKKKHGIPEQANNTRETREFYQEFLAKVLVIGRMKNLPPGIPLFGLADEETLARIFS